MGDQELEELGVLSVLHEQNAEIQAFASLEGDRIPPELLRLLSDLDWTVRNGYADTRGSVVRRLRRRAIESWGTREVLRDAVRDAVDRLRTRRWRGDPVSIPEPDDGEAGDGHRRWEDVRAEREEREG